MNILNEIKRNDIDIKKDLKLLNLVKKLIMVLSTNSSITQKATDNCLKMAFKYKQTAEFCQQTAEFSQQSADFCP